MTDVLTRAVKHLTPGERDLVNMALIDLVNMRNPHHNKFLQHVSGSEIVYALYRLARDERQNYAFMFDHGITGMVGLS